MIRGSFSPFLHKKNNNNIHCVTLEAPCRGASDEYPQHMFSCKIIKIKLSRNKSCQKI